MKEALLARETILGATTVFVASMVILFIIDVYMRRPRRT